MYDYKYSNEELENYLNSLKESTEEFVSVDKNFLLELAREVLFYHGLADEHKDIVRATRGQDR
ncbi:MAG: hypothetical protein IJ516_03285 [Phascolarctobacterium sp.]|nr:hypothetical protein [Phascolarctobacterium sp.]